MRHDCLSPLLGLLPHARSLPVARRKDRKGRQLLMAIVPDRTSAAPMARLA